MPISWGYGGGRDAQCLCEACKDGRNVCEICRRGRPPKPDELQATQIMKGEPGFCVTDGGYRGHYFLTSSRLWIKKVRLGHFVDRTLWGRTFVHMHRE